MTATALEEFEWMLDRWKWDGPLPYIRIDKEQGLQLLKEIRELKAQNKEWGEQPCHHAGLSKQEVFIKLFGGD